MKTKFGSLCHLYFVIRKLFSPYLPKVSARTPLGIKACAVAVGYNFSKKTNHMTQRCAREWVLDLNTICLFPYPLMEPLMKTKWGSFPSPQRALCSWRPKKTHFPQAGWRQRLRLKKFRQKPRLMLSHFSCARLCNPIDGRPLGSPVPGILQAITLEWIAISFSN